jgi:hypothetical protein
MSVFGTSLDLNRVAKSGLVANLDNTEDTDFLGLSSDANLGALENEDDMSAAIFLGLNLISYLEVSK